MADDRKRNRVTSLLSDGKSRERSSSQSGRPQSLDIPGKVMDVGKSPLRNILNAGASRLSARSEGNSSQELSGRGGANISSLFSPEYMRQGSPEDYRPVRELGGGWRRLSRT
mmetsp:Transcript_5025/g.14112  ORF Transcript_5025/g.14112 Transcript_5025/m.14112 type:complete len:112 (-) Transcript_5025:5467-5802(-)